MNISYNAIENKSRKQFIPVGFFTIKSGQCSKYKKTIDNDKSLAQIQFVNLVFTYNNESLYFMELFKIVRQRFWIVKYIF